MIATHHSMLDVRHCAQVNGSHWFDPDTMRFFKSRVGSSAYTSKIYPNLVYFVSSERFKSAFHTALGDIPYSRKYTVRYCNMNNGQIDDLGEFQQYATWKAADRAARVAAESAELPD